MLTWHHRMLRILCSILLILLGTVSAIALAGDPERPLRIPGQIPIPEFDRSERIRAHVQLMFQTPHAAIADERTPFAEGLCLTCHGADMDMLFNPEEETSERLNQPCLSCHEEGARRHWRGSTHAFSGMACIDCHAMHNTRPKLLKTDTQLELCSTCHLDRRADFKKTSHHPIPEGLMQCTDCHNPHGSAGEKKLIAMTINETCYSCHAEKRGPVMWQHAPVQENCTYCHDPHGSMHRPLLISRPPFLCQQCHLGTHSSTALTASHQDFRIQGRSCLNCHNQVHGSNHPRGYTLRN